MTQQDFGFDSQHRGKSLEPAFVTVLQLYVCRPVGCSHLLDGAVNKLAVVVAPYVEPGLAHQHIGGGRGLQWTGKVIAEVHNKVGRLFSKVRLNGLERLQISVYVGNHRDSQNFPRGHSLARPIREPHRVS